MEELSNIAMAYYQASSEHLKNLAADFFNAMDHDRDGKIDQKEFMEFMKQQGHGQMMNPVMFTQLDLDRNGTLDFREVMTLYYIIKSGRPFCEYCKKFITSTYFTCVGCLEDLNGWPYHLCVDCYSRRVCYHTHNNNLRFVDNYSLLEAMTKLKIDEIIRSRPNGTAHSGHYHTWNPSSPMVQYPQQPYHVPNQHYSGSQYASFASVAPPVHNHSYNHPPPHYHVQQPSPIVQQQPYNHPPPHYHVQQPSPIVQQQPAAIVPQRPRWETTLQVLNAGLLIGTIGSSFCTIL